MLRALSLSCGQRVRRMRNRVARSERGSAEERRGWKEALRGESVDVFVFAEAEGEVMLEVARDLGRGWRRDIG